MRIILSNSSRVPIYEQLVEQIKSDIINRDLYPNDPLPSVRALSAELRISALTVKKAYDKLEEEGYVVTVHGKGTYVAPSDSQLAAEARKAAMEGVFAEVIEKAKLVGMTGDEIRELVDLILTE